MNDFKEFTERYIPYKDLKKIGFFDKNIRFNDYQKIVERFLCFFGYESMNEYIFSHPTIQEGQFVNLSTPSYVNSKGEFINGISGHISF